MKTWKRNSEESEGASFVMSAMTGFISSQDKLHNIKVSSETVSADMVDAWEFPESLWESIDEGMYLPKSFLMWMS